MTQIRHQMIIRKVKDITMGSAVFFTFLGGGISMQNCVSTQNLPNSTLQTGNKLESGICSYIKEESVGNFKIFDEKKIALDSTSAIIEGLNGKKDTLKLKETQALIDDFIKKHQDKIGKDNSLENVLLFGGIGYVFSKLDDDNEYEYYRNKYLQSKAFAEADSTENLWNQPYLVDGYSDFNTYFYTRFYFTPQIYRRSIFLRSDIFGPRYIFNAPHHSSSGHFSYHHSYSSFGG